MASHIGGHFGINEVKIRAVYAICDSVEGVKYNWENWFINQLLEAGKDFIPCENDSSLCTLKAKLRYSRRISYALEKLFLGRIWKNMITYQKKPILHDLV